MYKNETTISMSVRFLNASWLLFEFASSLVGFYRGQAHFNRTFTLREQAMMFLHQGMANNDPGYKLATHQLIHDPQQIPDHTPLPPRFCNPTLPLTLLSHPSAIGHLGINERIDQRDTRDDSWIS